MWNQVKISYNPFPEDDKVVVTEVSVTYSQTGDCTRSKDECQDLTITLRNGGVDASDAFVNIKTSDDGWSIGSPSEIQEIIQDFWQRVNKFYPDENKN